MLKTRKLTFLLTAAFVLIFTVSAVSGCNDTRTDNKTSLAEDADDVRDGFDIAFVPADGYDASAQELDIAADVIKTRLSTLGINDNEVSSDCESDRIIVHFPRQADENEFDDQAVVQELCEKAQLTFRKGTETETDAEGNIHPAGEIVLTGNDIESACCTDHSDEFGFYDYGVTLKLKASGETAFTAATTELANTGTPVSIWMDDTMISAPTVNNTITGDSVEITGSFDSESAKKLADQINSGALPFKLEVW